MFAYMLKIDIINLIWKGYGICQFSVSVLTGLTMLTDLTMFTRNRLSKFGINNKVDVDFDCLHIVDVVFRVDKICRRYKT